MLMFSVLLLLRVAVAHVVLIFSAIVFLLFFVPLVLQGSEMSVRGDALSLVVVVLGNLLLDS